MSSQLKSRVTVSGPGLDVVYPQEGAALSRAITAASQATDEATFYVRDGAGQLLAMVERNEDGTITARRVWRGS